MAGGPESQKVAVAMKPLAFICLVFAAVAAGCRELRHGCGVIELCLVALSAAVVSWLTERKKP